MKRAPMFWWTIPALLLTPDVSPAQKAGDAMMTVAVAEFRTQGVPAEVSWLGRSFADAVVGTLSRSRSVRVVEREYLDKVLAELKFQVSDVVDEASAVRIGRLLGARAFVFGTVGFLGEEVIVRARIVSIERAEVTGVAESTGDKTGLLNMQKDIGTQIASHLVVENALAGGETFEVTELTVTALGNLDQVRAAARLLPNFGLDPARSRRRTEYQSALTICDQLLKAYPRLWQARYYRALFLLHAEDFERSLVEVEALLLQHPQDVDAHLLRGNILYASRRGPDAVQAFQRCTEIFPDDARSWYAYGRLLAATGRNAEAIDAYVRALERSPVVPEAEPNLRTLVAGADRSLADLEKLRPGLGHVVLLFGDFWKGAVSFPKEEADATVASFPRLFIGYYAVGVATQRVGDAGAAEKAWRTCLGLRPSFPEVHRELGVLMLRNKRCAEGREHVRLYMRTTSYVPDFSTLDTLINDCK
jgi:tetratricopeptide (TPR) repeat protein/TolB-like protein